MSVRIQIWSNFTLILFDRVKSEAQLASLAAFHAGEAARFARGGQTASGHTIKSNFHPSNVYNENFLILGKWGPKEATEYYKNSLIWVSSCAHVSRCTCNEIWQPASGITITCKITLENF